MRCPRCQQENPPEAQFCFDCRADLRLELERLGRGAPPGRSWNEVVADLRGGGANALARSAHREAVALFEQALAAVKNLPENRATIEQAIDLRLDLRDALWPLGELGRILDCLREAEPLAAALGEPLEVPEPEPTGGAVVRFLVPPEGVLQDVDGLEEAVAVEGVVDARVYRSPGWEFGPFRRGNDRAGYVLARGESRDDALARADRAAELIRFRTADAEALLEA